jgi:flagellar secretion chaperone FliS
MPSSARDNYLTTEVTTAPPQKLHLMLIEAALRFSERARRHWEAHEDELALDSLLHAQEVVNELMCGLNRELDSALVGKAAALYLFVFRCLVEAGHRHDGKKLADAIRVLEIDRETWRQVCEKMAVHHDVDGPTTVGPQMGLPGLSGNDDFSSAPMSGFSLEA